MGKLELAQKKIWVLLFLIIFYASGCTIIHDQPIHSIDLSESNDKLNMTIGLVLSDEFLDSKMIYERTTETHVTPIGENLAHHSKRLMRSTFANMVLIENHQIPPGVNYLMEPELVVFENARSAWVFGKAKISLSIEWKISDRSGKLVWVKTINGTGIGTGGNTFTYKKNEKEMIKIAMQNLFEESQNTMLSSQILRSLK